MNDKISTRQAWLLVSTATVATVALYQPAYAVQTAGNDAWLAIVITIVIAFPVTILVLLPGLRFPGQNFVECCESILGKIPGKGLALLFVLAYLVILATTIRELGEIMAADIFPLTPMVVLVSSMLIISTYAVNRGIEAIARVGEIVAVITFVSILLVLLASLKDANWSNLTPVLEKGWRPVWSGIGTQLPFMPQIIVLAFLLDKLNSPPSAIKASLGYVLLVGPTLAIVVVVAITVFTSEYAATLLAPLLSLARGTMISFITRIEALAIGLWLLAGLVRLSLFYYLIVSTLQQIFGLQNYRCITLPTGLIAAALSIVMFANTFELNQFVTGTMAMYHPLLFIGFPALLLLVAIISRQGEPTLPTINRASKEIITGLAAFASGIIQAYQSIVPGEYTGDK